MRCSRASTSDAETSACSFPAASSRCCHRPARFLGRPSVLLLDEPLEGLAPVICEELMKAFAELAKTGDMTILLVGSASRAPLISPTG